MVFINDDVCVLFGQSEVVLFSVVSLCLGRAVVASMEKACIMRCCRGPQRKERSRGECGGGGGVKGWGSRGLVVEEKRRP